MRMKNENEIETDAVAGAAASAAASRETTVKTVVKPGAAAEAAAPSAAASVSISFSFSFFISHFHFSFQFCFSHLFLPQMVQVFDWPSQPAEPPVKGVAQPDVRLRGHRAEGRSSVPSEAKINENIKIDMKNENEK